MFLLFQWFAEKRKEALENLHSNMFLLFPHRFSDVHIECVHLHSNMFLLFRFLRLGNPALNTIYIPICFYYFLSWSFIILSAAFIYIPICFYYFCFSRTSFRYTIQFTFQYVSIISLKTDRHG